MKRILYISYDGMTDPLGQSQVLPYVIGLTKAGYQFTILSFEKKDRYAAHRATIEKITSDNNIEWVPLSFTTNPPLLSKFYDAIRMRKKADELYGKYKFDMIHCRSYIAADIGLELKKKYGCKFFFDMRGFWADEKRDAGRWKKDHFLFDRVYRYYKNKEKEYLQHADYIISLTYAGKREMETWEAYDPSVPLSVIPCCADMNHFSLTSSAQKEEGRRQLGLPQEALVVSYLGSVGAWYMLDEMLVLFKTIKEKFQNAMFLFITHSDRKMIEERMATFGISTASVKIVEANRQQVPVYVKASDINISFIKPVYSKISSSPTKLGEVLSMGIPVIVNDRVGDVKEIVEASDAGIVIHDFNEATYQSIANSIPELVKKDPSAIRTKSENTYSLDEGIRKYTAAYTQIFSSSK